MPEISITDFTDFILRTGPPKISKVTEVFKRGEYDPAHDFWKLLRESICEFHEGKLSQLTFNATGASEKKRVRYEEGIKGYKKFLSAMKGNQWFDPAHSKWQYEDLVVRINPEDGFVIESKPVLVKLYFKQVPLTQAIIQVALCLMREAQANKQYRVAYLDVARSKLHLEKTANPQMSALLQGEAATFLAIWNSLAS